MKTNLLLTAVTLLTLSRIANSSEIKLQCEWQDSGFTPSFYRPAQFDITFSNKGVSLSKDSFFYRAYSPCWDDQSRDCAFSIEYPAVIDFEIAKTNYKNFQIPFYSADGYGLGYFDLKFSKKIKDLEVGEKMSLSLNGDDGDGINFENHNFLCLKLK